MKAEQAVFRQLIAQRAIREDAVRAAYMKFLSVLRRMTFWQRAKFAITKRLPEAVTA